MIVKTLFLKFFILYHQIVFVLKNFAVCSLTSTSHVAVEAPSSFVILGVTTFLAGGQPPHA
jgi:hypothetical protein